MSNVIRALMETIIREEEVLNSRYAELSRHLDNPLLRLKFAEYQKQGRARISELHTLWKSIKEPKP